jgi:hypothetical protein
MKTNNTYISQNKAWLQNKEIISYTLHGNVYDDFLKWKIVNSPMYILQVNKLSLYLNICRITWRREERGGRERLP